MTLHLEILPPEQRASLDDLLAKKLKVMLQHVEWKDYCDVAALLNSGVDLSKALSIARKMFGPTFQPSESLKALTYFKGGDLDQLGRATVLRSLTQRAACVIFLKFMI